MKRKAQLLILLSIALGTISTLQAKPTMDKFTACKLYVLVSNCNIGRDAKAPAYMKEGGPASCFVGLDVAPKDDARAQAPFNQIIMKHTSELFKESLRRKLRQTRIEPCGAGENQLSVASSTTS